MSSIKQRVNIRSHCKSICNGILTFILKWFDMCCFQNFWHRDICNDASLTCRNNIVPETSLIGTALPEGLHSLSFDFRHQIRASNLLKHLLKRGIRDRRSKHFSDFVGKEWIEMVLFILSSPTFTIINISVV